MMTLLAMSILPLLLTIGIPGFATALVTNEDQSRALTLIRPLSHGEIVVDYPTLGRHIAKILSGADVPELSLEDRAVVLASFMHVWQIKTPERDWIPGVLDRTLSTIGSELEFEELPEDDDLRRTFSNLRIALLVVEAHRDLTSTKENGPLRDTFAHLAFGVILSIFERRAEGKKMPSDDQLISLLTKFRVEAGPDSRVTWWQLVELMRREMDGSIRKTVETARSTRLVVGVFTGMISGAGLTLSTVALGMFNVIDFKFLGGAGQATLATAPIIGLTAGVGSMALTNPRQQREIRAQAEDFVERCHAALVQ